MGKQKRRRLQRRARTPPRPRPSVQPTRHRRRTAREESPVSARTSQGSASSRCQGCPGRSSSSQPPSEEESEWGDTWQGQASSPPPRPRLPPPPPAPPSPPANCRMRGRAPRPSASLMRHPGRFEERFVEAESYPVARNRRSPTPLPATPQEKRAVAASLLAEADLAESRTAARRLARQLKGAKKRIHRARISRDEAQRQMERVAVLPAAQHSHLVQAAPSDDGARNGAVKTGRPRRGS